MAEFNVDVTRLPDDVREKLAELELELSEGKYSKFLSLVSSPLAVFSTWGSIAGVVATPAPGLRQPLY